MPRSFSFLPWHVRRCRCLHGRNVHADDFRFRNRRREEIKLEPKAHDDSRRDSENISGAREHAPTPDRTRATRDGSKAVVEERGPKLLCDLKLSAYFIARTKRLCLVHGPSPVLEVESELLER